MYNTSLGIGTSILLIIIFISTFILLPRQKQTLIAWTLLATGIAASIMISVRANGAVQAFDAFLVGLSYLLLLLVHSADKVTWQGLWLFALVGDYVFNLFKNIPLLIKYRKAKQIKSKIDFVSVIKIGILTIIVVFVFAQILSSADPIFKQIIESFIDEFYGRLAAVIITLLVFLLLLTVRIPEEEKRQLKLSFLKYSEIIIPSLAVVIVFALFITIQIKYLFLGSNTQLSTFGLTYSQYARKGFMEIIVGTLLGGALVYFIYLKQKTLELPHQIKYLALTNIALVLELFVLLASAATRDLMYVQAYGYTRTRIFGFVILGWLLFVLVTLLLINIFRKKVQESYTLGLILIATLILYIGINAFNIDSFIATANPPSNAQYSVDYYYITSLSEDTASDWVTLLPKMEDRINILLPSVSSNTNSKEELGNIYAALLQMHSRIQYLTKKYGTSEQAQNVLDEYKKSNDYYYGNYYTKQQEDELKRMRKWQSINLSEYKAAKMILSDASLDAKVVELMEKLEKDSSIRETIWQEAERLVYQIDRPFIKHLDYDSLYIRRSMYPSPDPMKYPIVPAN